MSNRIKLAGFIVIISASIIISLYLDDLVDAMGTSDGWQGWAIPPSIFVFILIIFGWLLKNFKEILSYSFFAGLILVIFIFVQMFYETNDDQDWMDITRSWKSFVLSFAVFTVIGFLSALSLMSFGMLSSYLYKSLFKPVKINKVKL